MQGETGELIARKWSCPSPWIFLSAAVYAFITILADTTSWTMRCRLWNTSPVRWTSRYIRIISHRYLRRKLSRTWKYKLTCPVKFMSACRRLLEKVWAWRVPSFYVSVHKIPFQYRAKYRMYLSSCLWVRKLSRDVRTDAEFLYDITAVLTIKNKTGNVTYNVMVGRVITVNNTTSNF